MILELFSGSGQFSTACRRRRALRHPAFEFDFEHDPSHDLCLRAVQQTVRGWLRGRLVCGVWLGTPCTSMTKARNIPGGPPPLRDALHVLGLPDLRPSDAAKVEIGNRLATFSACIFLLARSLNIPVALENPSTSWLWSLPCIQRIMQLNNVQITVVDYCAYGKPWRKRTTIMSCHVPTERFTNHVCHGRGTCEYSGRPHVQLKGQDHTGKFLTKIAEPYPSSLSSQLAAAFSDGIASKTLNALAVRTSLATI